MLGNFLKLLVAKITAAQVERVGIIKVIVLKMRHVPANIDWMLICFLVTIHWKKKMEPKYPRTMEFHGVRCAHIIRCTIPTKNPILRNFQWFGEKVLLALWRKKNKCKIEEIDWFCHKEEEKEKGRDTNLLTGAFEFHSLHNVVSNIFYNTWIIVF